MGRQFVHYRDALFSHFDHQDIPVLYSLREVRNRHSKSLCLDRREDRWIYYLKQQ